MKVSVPTEASPVTQRLPRALSLIPLTFVAYQNLFVIGWSHAVSTRMLATILLALALFSLFHNISTLRWRNALALFGIAWCAPMRQAGGRSSQFL